MCGAVIGDNSIVDANSLVMKNEFIKQRSIVQGVPAQYIGYNAQKSEAKSSDLLLGETENPLLNV
jgi:carbonic anhydrase/acetyltransferase-like protein (isoleucine patch superfamily)